MFLHILFTLIVLVMGYVNALMNHVLSPVDLYYGTIISTIIFNLFHILGTHSYSYDLSTTIDLSKTITVLTTSTSTDVLFLYM